MFVPIKTAMTRFGTLFELDGPGRIVPMEGLRGVAILMVLFVHHAYQFRGWANAGSLTDRYAAVAHSVGQAGVDLFFAISGFLVYSLALAWRGTWAGFVGRRLRRIYPPFLASMLVYVILFLAAPDLAKWPAGGEVWYTVQSLLLLPGVFDVEPVMTVAWSLSYELAFYLALPVFVAGLRLQTWRRESRIVLIAVAICAYCAGSMIWFPGGLGWVPYEFWNRPRYLLFGCGMLAWECFDAARKRRASAWSPATALVLTVGALAACHPLSDPAYQQPLPSILRSLLLGAASFALFQASFRNANWLAKALCWRPLRLLGNCSYSFYLVHSLGVHATGMAADRWFPSGRWGDAVFWLALPLTVMTATMVSIPLFLFVERPFSLRRPAPARNR